MTNVKSLKKAAAAIFAAVLCLSAVVFSGFQNVIPDMALQAKAAAADEYLTEFLNSGYDKTRVTIYDGSNEENYFMMNGRKYFQGLVIGNNNYEDGGSVTFNVEDINSISFDLCRIDNTGMEDATIQFYRDGSWWRDIAIGNIETWKKVELDVSEITTLKISYTADYTKYGFGDFAVDGKKSSLTYEKPVYSSSYDFISSRYDSYRNVAYDGTNEFNYFNMNGRQYYQGLVIGNNNYEDGGSLTWNVENVNKISFTINRIDSTGMKDITLKVHRDGYWWQDITVGNLEVFKTVNLDLSDISTLRIYYEQDYTKYGLGDIKINSFSSEMPFTKPSYSNAVEMINARYDSYRNVTFDGSNEFNYFSMNGKKYYQGVVIGNNNYEDGSSFTWNVENINRVTFTLGRVDDTGQEDISFWIMKDGSHWYNIKFPASQVAKAYTIDTSDIKTLRFYYDEDYSQYALANIAINGDYSDFSDGTYAVNQKVYTDASKITDIDKIIEEEAAKDAAKANLGDVNEDGTVDSSDASKVLAAYAAVATGGSLGLTETQELNADVNMDGAVDSSDASSILGFYAYSATGGEGTMAEYMGV